MMDTGMPDSQELAEEVISSVRVTEIGNYGRDKLPAGPGIEEAEDIIIVEGRADVITLLKQGFKNVIAMNGTKVPDTIKELTQKKETLVFVDGDRGGNLIIKELLAVAEIDFVTKAPDGKEVEELTKKEIHKALRSKITAEQAKLELASVDTSQSIRKPMINRGRPAPTNTARGRTPQRGAPTRAAPVAKPPALSPNQKKQFEGVLSDLVGTKGACLLDEKMTVLGKVPLKELSSTLSSLKSGVFAVVLDDSIDQDVVTAAERANVKYVIGMESKVNPTSARVGILTSAEL
jgi:5S rRNA maturation endonuclease (ribonuclease M5)